MKKIIYILFILFFVSINIFSYNYILNKQILDTLITNKQMLVINYDESNTQTSETFIKKIVEFSRKEKVNISQYNFLDEKTLNIYVSNIKNEPSVYIKQKYLQKERYISNFKNADNKKHIGTINFPLSTWKIRYFDIDQVNNVGIGNKFYISTTDNKVIKKAISYFSSFGEVKIEDNSTNSFLMFNKTLFLLVLFSLLIFSIGIFYFIIKNRKQLLLHKLWGYSKIKSLLSLLKIFLKSFVVIALFGGLLLVILTIFFNLSDWLITYVQIYILNILISALIWIGCIIIITLILYKNNDISNAIKGSLPFKKFQWLSLGFKLIVTFFLFNIIALSLSNLFDLKQQLENKSYWNRTKTIYTLNFANNGIDYNDLKVDREKNDKVHKLYHELEYQKNAFIMYADNYSILGKDGKNPIYFYTLNTTKENEIYSPSGRNVTIDTNYLKVNPIFDINGQPITKNQLNFDLNTLNLLVPQKYTKYEEKIIKAYKDQFFFRKVEVENLYNKEILHPLNTIKRSQLNVNIIYTKNKQKYFTFNSAFGNINDQNNITDPIATVYTDNVDTSYIGGYATTSLFFFDESKGEAYQHLTPYLEKTDTKSLINASVSVYQELSDQIAKIQKLFIENLIGLVIAIILSLAFLVSHIWSYYSANAYRLYLKDLFGYSYWRRNKHLIILSFISNFLIGLGVSFFYNVFEIVYSILLFIGIELIVLYFLSKYLNRKNMNKIIKGDKL